MKKRKPQISVKDGYGDVVRGLENLYDVMVDMYGKISVYHDVRRFWEYDEKGEFYYLPITEYMKTLTLLDLSLSIYEDYKVGGHHDVLGKCTKLVYRLTLDVMRILGIEVKNKRLRYYDYISSVPPLEFVVGIKSEDYYVYDTIGAAKPKDAEDTHLSRFLDTAKRLMDLLDDKTKEE